MRIRHTGESGCAGTVQDIASKAALPPAAVLQVFLDIVKGFAVNHRADIGRQPACPAPAPWQRPDLPQIKAEALGYIT